MFNCRKHAVFIKMTGGVRAEFFSLLFFKLASDQRLNDSIFLSSIKVVEASRWPPSVGGDGNGNGSRIKFKLNKLLN